MFLGVMLMKKRTLGQRYTHFVTKKPLFFYGFIFMGIGLFLWLTLTTSIETNEGVQSLFYTIFMRAGSGL